MKTSVQRPKPRIGGVIGINLVFLLTATFIHAQSREVSMSPWGATDEIGAKAAEVVHPIRDLHVTLLHLLGLNDNKLTYFHAGRYKQLSQFGGQVIKELIG